METKRQRQINNDAVIKCVNFLTEVKNLIQDDRRFSIHQVAVSFHMDKYIATTAIRKGIFDRGVTKGEYLLGENFGNDITTAKKLIEWCRIGKLGVVSKNIGKIDGVSKENISDDQIDVPKIERDTGAKITSILERAFSKVKPINNTLFSESEKEFEDKLKIACAISTGCYVQDSNQAHKFSYAHANDFIVAATNDLYKKLKSK